MESTSNSCLSCKVIMNVLFTKDVMPTKLKGQITAHERLLKLWQTNGEIMTLICHSFEIKSDHLLGHFLVYSFSGICHCFCFVITC